MADSIPSTKPSRIRLIVLLSILCVLAVISYLNRSRLVSVTNAYARECFEEGHLDKTRWWLKVSQQISVRNYDTQLLLARLMRREHRLKEARMHLETAHRWGAPTDKVRREQQLLFAQSGAFREALPHLGELLRTSSDPTEVYEAFALGAIRSRNHLRTAYGLLAIWTSEFSEDPRPHYLLAQLCNIVEDVQRGEFELRRAVELSPNYAPANLALSELLIARKQPLQAMKCLNAIDLTAVDEQTRSQTLLAQAQCLRLLGHTGDARPLLDTVLAMHPTSDNARVELALGDIHQGRFKSAVATLKAVLQSNSQDHDARYALATALRSLGKLDESNAHFRMASQGQNRMSIARYLTVRLLADETNVDLRREIGELYLQFGSEGEGLAWLDSALELAPRHRPTLQILADYYQKKSVDRPQAKQLETEYKQRLQKL